MLRRRKKRKLPTVVNSKKKSAPTSPRGPGRPCSSFSRPAPVTSPARSQTPGAPTTNINNNININIGSSSNATVSRRQHCPYCGRHYRSLARHLEKHHANQPEVRTAMELAHLHTHNSSNGSAAHPNPSSSSAAAAPHSHSFAIPQPSASNTTPPSLFSRERDSPATRPNTGGVSFSLSLSPPSTAQPAANKKGPSLPTATTKRPATQMVSRVKTPSPPPPSTPRRGRRMKKEKHEEQQKVEVESESSRGQEELVPPPTPEPDIDPDEELELSAEGEDDAPEEKNGEIVRCVPLLSLRYCVNLMPSKCILTMFFLLLCDFSCFLVFFPLLFPAHTDITCLHCSLPSPVWSFTFAASSTPPFFLYPVLLTLPRPGVCSAIPASPCSSFTIVIGNVKWPSSLSRTIATVSPPRPAPTTALPLAWNLSYLLLSGKSSVTSQGLVYWASVVASSL